MSLENTELKIGKTSFKGIWIAVVLTLGTSVGGTVWTASSLYSRLEAVESKKIPDVAPITQKLATLGTHLETILGQQEKLLELNTELSELSKEIESMKAVVKQGELIAESMSDVDQRIKKINTEIEELWQGMDFVMSNPLER